MKPDIFLTVALLISTDHVLGDSFAHDSFIEMHDMIARSFYRNRSPRSIEGAPCSVTSNTIITPVNGPQYTVNNNPADSCQIFPNLFAYTRCNPATLQCECDPRVSVRLALFPGTAVCIPLSYVNATAGCFPTAPDMCSVVVFGSYCAVGTAPSGARAMRCQCRFGGNFPNCTARIGPPSPCLNTTGCTYQIPGSYCVGQTNTSFGTCNCPTQGAPLGINYDGTGQMNPSTAPATTVPNSLGNQCLPRFCPTDGSSAVNTPCQGDATAYLCVNTTAGFQCYCKDGSKGRPHNITTTGRCCAAGNWPCADYSKCLTPTQFCDGNVDCADCSDEKGFFCSGAWPVNPACGPPPPGRMTQEQINRMAVQQETTTTTTTPPPPINPFHFDPLPMPADSAFSMFQMPAGKTFKDLQVVSSNKNSLTP